MKKSKAWALYPLIAVLVATGFLYWPRPMAGLINWDHPVQAIHIAMARDEAAPPSLGTRSYVLTPGSQAHKALADLFAGFRWHKGFDTLFRDGMAGFKGQSAIQFQEMSPNGSLIEVAEGSGMMSIAGKAAKIGYFGAGDAKKLVAGVMDILAPLSPDK